MNTNSKNTKSFLLIVSCSDRKLTSIDQGAALCIYDGPVYRTIRKFLRENETISEFIQLVILSAKYGFISGNKCISQYNERMTKQKANSNRVTYHNQLKKLIEGKKFARVMVNVGGDYSGALPELEQFLDGTPEIVYASGRIGERLSQTKTWLHSLSQ